MTKQLKYLVFSIFWSLNLVGIFFYFNINDKFLFPYIEQNQVFLFDWNYILEKLSVPSGGANLLKEFILQFFIIKNAGPFISALLLVLSGILMQTIVSRINSKSFDILLFTLPVITQMPLILNFDYQISGLISFIIVLVFITIYLLLKHRSVKLVFALLSTIFLYWFTGSASLYYAISILLYESVNDFKHFYYYSLPLLALFALARFSVYDLYISKDIDSALSPSEYYNKLLTPGKEIYYCWILLPITIFLSSIMSKLPSLSTKLHIISLSVQSLCIVGITYFLIKEESYYTKNDTKKFLEYDYYLRNNEWDKIIEESASGVSNYLTNYAQNIALIQKGIFTDKAFAYTQKGLESLTIDWSDNNPFVFPLISDMNFAIGNTSISQEVAFKKLSESLAVNNSLNPRMLKRLIETNIVYGGHTGYSVAGKYINLLKETLFYKDWAKQKEIYLFNDSIVENDSILGSLRRNLKNIDILYSMHKDFSTLKDLSFSGFSRNSLDYYCMGYLLNTDLESFYQVISNCFGNEILKELPKSYQEALLIYGAQNKLDLSKYKISEDTRKQFLMFQDFAAKNFNRKDLGAIMKKSYHDTYWYYFMFTKN